MMGAGTGSVNRSITMILERDGEATIRRILKGWGGRDRNPKLRKENG